ncbi:G-protein coupled receptor 157-like isoform X2 [Halichondria panicea]|uniref:G-protein coupled receptor 157-like isoform X2 n=1 Tax=Halichondria panicea TaxID=6063 RepID=UPI00312BA3C3
MEELFEASNVDYCVQPEQDCSHVQSNNSYSSFSVGPVPCYLSIVSDTLSCIACVTMLAIYITWADIRQNIAQAIVTFIAIADFLTAAGYLTGSFNLLTHVFTDRRPDRRGCDVFTTVCEVQSYIVTYATMSSYFWTIILAFHFYMTIAQERPNFTKRLLPFYHLIAWGVPILIAFPLLCVGKLAYAPFVTGMWCYMEIYRNSPPFGDNGTAVSVVTQLPEIVAFFLIIVLFSLTWITIYKQAKVVVHQGGLLVREQAVAMERVSRVSRILLFVPVLFVLLRVWAVVQFLYISYLSHLTDESGRCIPTDPHKTIHVALGVLQAIGAGGQGWTNAILYIFFSPKIRRRLLCCFFARCKEQCGKRKSRESQNASVTQCSPLLESVTSASFVRDRNVV